MLGGFFCLPPGLGHMMSKEAFFKKTLIDDEDPILIASWKDLSRLGFNLSRH